LARNHKEKVRMSKALRRFALALFALAAVPLADPGIAHAQLRDFEGKVDTVNEKKIIVDNRKGDKISFDKVADTTVEGDKKSWEEVKKGDWVAVSSKMLEKPRKAYKVTVKPAPPEAGVEE
jgi:hypothetical protein